MLGIGTRAYANISKRGTSARERSDLAASGIRDVKAIIFTETIIALTLLLQLGMNGFELCDEYYIDNLTKRDGAHLSRESKSIACKAEAERKDTKKKNRKSRNFQCWNVASSTATDPGALSISGGGRGSYGISPGGKKIRYARSLRSGGTPSRRTYT